MSKTEVYSWRLTPDLKRRLELVARQQGISMGGLIEAAVIEHVSRGGGHNETDEQVRLREELSGVIAAYRSDDSLGSAEVKKRVRTRITEKLGRG